MRSTIPSGAGDGGAVGDPQPGGGDEMTDGSDRRRGSVADRVRILVVDDHALFCVGISNILGREKDFEVIGEAESSRGVIEAAEAHNPDFTLFDASPPSP